ncbi:MAG: DUF99 domain-containing protein [Candidatus Thorarchaeota archaeon]|nr:MAG: DUF99 domain-containing protein [Candidatus Thorarchaeota archaeon]
MTEHVHDLASSDVRIDNTGWKSGVRVLGIAESFEQSDKSSTVAGVVMRGDIRIDGYGFCRPTIGGLDATDRLASMYESLQRQDIRAWMLGGSVISWFNVVDLQELHERTGTPVACVSYRHSEGIEKYVKEYFPDDWKKRIDVLDRTGERVQIRLSTGYQVYLSVAGMTVNRGRRLIDLFTLDGAIPEPIRAARILAASIRHSGSF